MTDHICTFIKCLSSYLDITNASTSNHQDYRMHNNQFSSTKRQLIWYSATELNSVKMRKISHLLKLLWMWHLSKLFMPIATIWWHWKKLRWILIIIKVWCKQIDNKCLLSTSETWPLEGVSGWLIGATLSISILLQLQSIVVDPWFSRRPSFLFVYNFG